MNDNEIDMENKIYHQNGYVCFWNGIRKKVRGYDISVNLCEKDGKPVIHTAVD